MRYYFHVCDETGNIADHEGADFSNLEDAQAEARACVRDMMANDLRGNGPVYARRIEIADEGGSVLDCISVALTPR